MAGEITYSAINDLTVAAVLHRMIREKLYDPTDIRGTARKAEFLVGGGSTVTKVGQYSRADAMASTAELAGPTNPTGITDGTFSLTIARYAIKRLVTDLARLAGSAGDVVNLEFLADWGVESFRLTMTDLIAALFSSVTASVNNTGNPMTLDQFMDGQFTLTRALAVARSCVIDQDHLTDLQEDLVGLGGPLQWTGQVPELMAQKGPGYQGKLLNTDVWSCDSVPTSGGDGIGCIYDVGAFEYQEADVSTLAGLHNNARVAAGSPVLIAYDYDVGEGQSIVVCSAFPAASIGENARACKLIADVD